MSAAHDVTTLTGRAGRLAAAASRLYQRAAARVRRMLEPFLPGYEEHGWSGRLFLLSGGLSIAGIAGGVIGGLGLALVTLDPGRLISALIGGLAARYVLIPLHRRFLLGVARFENWAQVLALVVSGGGVISGAAALAFGSFGVRGVILTVAQTALSAQFFIYFCRHGRWRHARDAVDTEAIEPIADAGALPPAGDARISRAAESPRD